MGREILLGIAVLGLILVILVGYSAEVSAENIHVVVKDHEGKKIETVHLDRTRRSILPPWKHLRGREIYKRKSDDTFQILADMRRKPNSIPITPQSFGHYKKVEPSIWIRIIDLDTGKVIKKDSMPLGNLENILSVPSGRYLVSSGTTIQVDEEGEWPTGIPVPPEGGTPQRLPDIPLVQQDDKGQWECYGLTDVVERLFQNKMGINEEQYVYILRKRYTYNTVASTITYVVPGENDYAYIPLLTDPDRLGELSAPTKSVKKTVKKWDNVSTVTNASFEGALATGLGKFLKHKIPIAAKHATATGIVAGAFTNVVYLSISEPDTPLDEEYMAGCAPVTDPPGVLTSGARYPLEGKEQ